MKNILFSGALLYLFSGCMNIPFAQEDKAPMPSYPIDNQSRPVSDHDNGRSYSLAQGVLGEVTDVVTGHPIQDARIDPKSLDTPTVGIPEVAVVTGNDGHYEWSLPPGVYEMSAHADGYQSATQRVEVVENKLATLNFFLKRKP